MPPDLRRRALLSSVAGLAATGLAGCSGLSERPLGALPSPPPEPITDLQERKIRVDEPIDLFRVDGAEADDSTATHDLVAKRSDLDGVRFNSEVRAALDMRDFVEATDFEDHVVVLFEQRVNACLEHHLVQIAYGDGDLDTEFCQSLRPADEACDPDREATVGYAIRLPFADVDIGSFGWGTGRGCEGITRFEDAAGESQGGDST